jgi:hypothetical protein
MKVLQVIDTAYRATIEEQDDTVVWITHAMRDAGAELAVLLSGPAVNYAVAEQDASGLCIGAWRQTQPPGIARDLGRLLSKRVPIYCIEEDQVDRGLHEAAIIQGVTPVPRTRIAQLFAEFDQVWRW